VALGDNPRPANGKKLIGTDAWQITSLQPSLCPANFELRWLIQPVVHPVQ
jgi:hypothetical protein